MEIWKRVNDYQDYMVSNTGKVKSLKYGKEKILKQRQNRKGYKHVALHQNGYTATQRVHTLVWEAFKNRDRTNLHIDHINEIKTDNRIENLQLLTARQNTAKYYKTRQCSSKYIGVSWHSKHKAWRATIYNNRKHIHLGLFITELEASNAYQLYLDEIK